VIRFFRDWVDDRTGLGKLMDAMLLEHIPGGARWRYVWGSALAIVFGIQLVTGVLLMTAYSPGDTTAWGSVYYIQYEMDFGWLIRGLHHFGSQTMVVLMALHVLQVVIAGAHLKPREVNWWLGLGLMAVILGLSLTGYLLPWDQKGYYATQVATNIAGGLPGVGRFVQKVVVGGTEYGNHTLTRFFSLHVAILPGAAIALLIAHIWVFRRHGVTTSRNPTGTGWFWPDQAFRDMLIGLIVFGFMLGLVLYGWGHKIDPVPGPDGSIPERSMYDKVAHAGKDGLGANLDAPADSNVDYPARPEWYFLFLFQLLKYFSGPQSLIGTVVIPGAIATALFVLPLLGYGKLRPLGHFVAVIAILALIGAVVYLTAQAWVEDQAPTTLEKQPYASIKKAVGANRYNPELGKAHQEHMQEADGRAHRAIQLAAAGIPATGGRDLLRFDPRTEGKKLFKANCASCHTYGDDVTRHDAIAADLANWGASEWIQLLLTNPDDVAYFGRAKNHLKGGKMSKWVLGQREKAKTNPQIGEDLDAIAGWLSTHPRQDPPTGDAQQDAFATGYRLFDKYCSECHSYKATKIDELEAPDLAGYGDDRWLREMMMVPQHPTKYGKNNRMPGFRDVTAANAALLEEPYRRAREEALKDVNDPKKKADIEQAHRVMTLGDRERELIIRYVLNDNRVVFGGAPIGGPPRK